MSVHSSHQKLTSSKPYLLFDAGGTLVFPDQPFLMQKIQEHGIELPGDKERDEDKLYNGYYRLIHELDCQARQYGIDIAEDPWPQGYVHALLESMGIGGPAAEAINQAAQARHRKKSLWTFTFSWIRETLDRLAVQGYCMSVISNSDDHTGRTLRSTEMTHYFDGIFNSAALGIAKPDPRIFEKVLRKLTLQPADALYIGDIYEVDVRGANAAGIGAIHLDPLGLYNEKEWPGVHLPDVRNLPNWLAQYAAAPAACNLFPFRRKFSSPENTAQTALQMDDSDKEFEGKTKGTFQLYQCVSDHYGLTPVPLGSRASSETFGVTAQAS
jgi:putative hydrolase of the HAD superfamily